MANTACRASLVACPLVDSIWPFVTYGLEHACMKGGGDLTSDYLWGLCRSGSAFLIAVADGEHVIGGAVLQFERWTSGRKLRVMCLYGERMAEWADQAKDLFFKIARDGGASSIVTDGRAGWARRYPEARVLRTTFEMDVKT